MVPVIEKTLATFQNDQNGLRIKKKQPPPARQAECRPEGGEAGRRFRDRGEMTAPSRRHVATTPIRGSRGWSFAPIGMLLTTLRHPDRTPFTVFGVACRRFGGLWLATTALQDETRRRCHGIIDQQQTGVLSRERTYSMLHVQTSSVCRRSQSSSILNPFFTHITPF
jgi:hypothetical protein